MGNYFARVSAGLELLAWQEIKQRTGAILQRFGHRRIDFIYNGPPTLLLQLRSVDDVYVYVTLLSGFDRTRADLLALQHKLGGVDWTRAVAVCSSVRPIGDPPTYKVTASYIGKRNYGRYDVEEAVHVALTDNLAWHFRPNRPSVPDESRAEDAADLDLRLLFERDWALVGLRLARIPLHRRPYKIASQPGSLKAPVAFCMCMLAGLQTADVVLDPMCGAGTIVAEATTLGPAGLIIGGDLQAGAVAATRQNLQALGVDVRTVNSDELALMLQQHAGGVRLYEGDVRNLQLPQQGVDVVISNLPWNVQVATGAEVAAFYSSVLRELERILRPAGRAVLLTSQVEALDAALARSKGLSREQRIDISLFGQHPAIYVLRKTTQDVELPA